MTTTIITPALAPTCIHGHEIGTDGFCHRVAIVDPALLARASAWKRAHWHEVSGVGYGYSDTITGTLADELGAAYDAAAARDGDIIWLRTPDYIVRTWIPDPDYTAWIAAFDALTTVDERRAAMEDETRPPTRGRWQEQVGATLAFLHRDAAGALRFEG